LAAVGTPGFPFLLPAETSASVISPVFFGYAILLSLAVSLNFAGDANPLLPFWGLLLILLIFYGVSRLFQHGPYAREG
jgi:hypothetical protein